MEIIFVCTEYNTIKITMRSVSIARIRSNQKMENMSLNPKISQPTSLKISTILKKGVIFVFTHILREF